MKKVNTNKVGGKLMTLKEEMQKNRDEEIKRMKEEAVEEAKNKIRERFLDKQSKDKKESNLKVHICWYNHDLILDCDIGNKIASGIEPAKAKREFIESLNKKLQEEEVGMVPDGDSTIAWFLTVELS